jgi:hypothetical protein
MIISGNGGQPAPVRPLARHQRLVGARSAWVSDEVDFRVHQQVHIAVLFAVAGGDTPDLRF